MKKKIQSIKLVKLTRKRCDDNLKQILQLIKYKREMVGHSYDYWKKEHVLKELPQKWNCSYLAFDKDELVGFVICYLKSPDELRLSKIFVLSNYRNLGIGTLFIEKFTQDAKKNNAIKATTCTADFNQGMMRFLERHKFTRTFAWIAFNYLIYYNYEREIQND